jgi:hypothetical protein
MILSAFAAAFFALVLDAPGAEAPPSAEGVVAELSVLTSGGAKDATTEADLARALSDAGVSVSAGEAFPRSCVYSCLHVVVRGGAPSQFYLEVRNARQAVRGALRLSTSASPFDQAHALAIQIELLGARARADAVASRRRPSRNKARAAIVADARESLRHSDGPQFGGLEPLVEDSQIDRVASAASLPPTVSIPAPTIQRTERVEPRVALGVSLTTLIGLSGEAGLVARGIALEARARLGERFDLRAGGALTGAERGTAHGGQFHRGVLPMYASTTIAIPHLAGLRAGAGIEAFFITGDQEGTDQPAAWSFGTRTSLVYSHAVRTFAMTAAANALFHPMALRTDAATIPPFNVPQWILSASLGLEFSVF